MKTIYYNGKVYTGELPLAEAFVEEAGRFTFAGSTAEALNLADSGDNLVDLGGCFAVSGFHDSHMHILNYGSALRTARLDLHTRSLADMVSCLASFPPVAGWIQGRGWNQDYFTDADRMPNRYDLDKASTEYPIYAVRACGHCLVVNSKALEILGITADTPQIEGGVIGMENGEPDGRIFDNAMDLVYEAVPVPDKEEIKDMIRAGCHALNSYGITACQSDDLATFAVPWQTVRDAFRELEEAGELTVRIYEQSNFASLEGLKEFMEAGNVTGTGSDFFRIGPLKMLGDGALGARTAYLSRPYADAPDTVGLPCFSRETLEEMVDYANAHGMQIAIHAIGDACLDMVLDAYEKALAHCPRKDHRHGIVHCQITRPDQLKRIRELNLHVYAQSVFLDYDIRIVEPRVGAELASGSYNWKTLMDMGTTVSNGSDCPVELPFALGGMQCAVTRRTLAGDTEAYLPDQAFSVAEALNSYTVASARAAFREGDMGRIAPGCLADFTVLEQNPFEVAPTEIKNIPIHAVYLGGRKVWKNS